MHVNIREKDCIADYADYKFNFIQQYNKCKHKFYKKENETNLILGFIHKIKCSLEKELIIYNLIWVMTNWTISKKKNK